MEYRILAVETNKTLSVSTENVYINNSQVKDEFKVCSITNEYTSSENKSEIINKIYDFILNNGKSYSIDVIIDNKSYGFINIDSIKKIDYFDNCRIDNSNNQIIFQSILNIIFQEDK